MNKLVMIIDDLKKQLTAAADRETQRDQAIDELRAEIDELKKPWYQKLFNRE